MKKMSSSFFWFGVLFHFIRRYYLAFPGFLLLLFGIGSFTCLVLGLLLISVNFVLSVSDTLILKRHLENSAENPMVFGGTFSANQDDSAPDIIDVDATETDDDENGE